MLVIQEAIFFGYLSAFSMEGTADETARNESIGRS
jgi:hypothetical protein